MSQHEQRRKRLRRLVRKTEADAILVTDETNVRYLTGFTGDSSYLLLSRDKAVVLSDKRYTTQLEDECADLELAIRGPSKTIVDLAGDVLRKAKISNVAVEANSLSVAQFDGLSSALASVNLVKTSGVVEGLREIKDKDEIRLLREAVRLAEKTYDVVRATIQADHSEKLVAFNLEHQIRMFGGEGCSFDPILAVGPNAALPHARPTDALIGDNPLLLMDWGAVYEGYHSDLTRILVTGRISPKLERIYGVVLKAQLAAIHSIKPGVAMEQVDAAAREVIAKAGHGKHFGHSLGHGIGLQIHEAPRLAANQPRLLEPGMVITIEPGIYLPGWGGVRIEDDVLVTKDGHEVLSSVTKDLAESVVS